MRIFSHGGGVQSTAVQILAAQGRVQYDAFLFCNVGADSENPATLEYIEKVAKPFAEKSVQNFIELQRHKRSGEVETLYGRIMQTRRSVPIPVRMSNGAPGHRTCTADFKIRIVAKWLKEHGATKDNPAIVGLGISLDELHRARTDSGIAWQTLEYPLIDLRLTRNACMNIIAAAGLPMPPKSSCYFCPFHSPVEWQRIKRETPELFFKAVAIEKRINEKRINEKLGRGDEVWLHPYLRPLEESVTDQLTFFDELSVCESGYCMV